MRPPFVWLFDLDDTLHDTSAAMFTHVNRRMSAFIERRFDLSRADADALRTSLWRRYGATLQGLVKLYGIDPHAFLHEVHEIDDFERFVRASHGAAHALARLPGRKILLTNGPRRYAERLLYHLGIDAHFRRRYMIEDMHIRGRFLPKPSRAMLAHVLARERLDPARCVLVEDTLANLRSAKAMRLKTVLVTGMRWRGRRPARPAWVDLKVQSVASLPRAIGRLR